MPLDVRGKVTGSKAVELHLGRMGALIRDMRPAIKPFLDSMYKKEARLFRNDGKAAGRGKKWPPLKRSTIRAKSSLARRGKIPKRNIFKPMRRTGRLLRSLTTRGGENIHEVTRQRGTFGTSVFYARFHRTRTRIRGGFIPARNVLKVTQRDNDELLDKVGKHLGQELERGKRGLIQRRQTVDDT